MNDTKILLDYFHNHIDNLHQLSDVAIKIILLITDYNILNYYNVRKSKRLRAAILSVINPIILENTQILENTPGYVEYYSNIEKSLNKPILNPITPLNPLKGLKYIIGPVSLVELYSKKYNKHIYLFGDVHLMSPVCDGKDYKLKNNRLLISEFLNLLTDNKNYDIFLEHWYDPKDKKYTEIYYKHTSFLKLINNERSRLARKPNVKFHYTDIRKKLTRRIMQKDKKDKQKDKQNEKDKIDKNKIKEYIEYYKWDNLSNILDTLKIEKQLENIKDPELYDILSKRLWSTLQKLYKRYNTEQDILSLINTIRIVLMDYYLLGRLFRTFSDGHTPTNVVIYVGDYHAYMYYNIFLMLGFKVINKTFSGSASYKESHNIKDTFQCIDVSKFKFD